MDYGALNFRKEFFRIGVYLACSVDDENSLPIEAYLTTALEGLRQAGTTLRLSTAPLAPTTYPVGGEQMDIEEPEPGTSALSGAARHRPPVPEFHSEYLTIHSHPSTGTGFLTFLPSSSIQSTSTRPRKRPRSPPSYSGPLPSAPSNSAGRSRHAAPYESSAKRSRLGHTPTQGRLDARSVDSSRAGRREEVQKLPSPSSSTHPSERGSLRRDDLTTSSAEDDPAAFEFESDAPSSTYTRDSGSPLTHSGRLLTPSSSGSSRRSSIRIQGQQRSGRAFAPGASQTRSVAAAALPSPVASRQSQLQEEEFGDEIYFGID